ncbi:glycine oxidase [Stella humosa]|uniref:Glycine oxidase n=1 Tax=Stella humosa TaxID=94 RepID=A0A3N1MCH5_9PROT|nr:glycine oxidase [Stella humosa]BBK31672.1 glycine oxidase ThiO [Stella humosa]
MVGGGICGLAAAWRLAEAGARVHVLDAGEIGHGATWAAGGMLAAALEAEPGEEGMAELARHSQALWPGWAARLASVTGIDVAYRGEGTLHMAASRDELAALNHRYRFLRRLGLPVEWREAAALRDLEPALSPDVVGAIAAPGDHQVDPRAVVPALAAAILAAGGRLSERTPVAAIEPDGGGWAIRTADGARQRADHLVLAAGAWSAGIAGLPPSARPPVRPAKGQAVVLGMDPAAPLLRHVVWGSGIYLVPRTDGRLYLGATVEDRGYDTRPTAGGVLSLLEAAWRLLPGLEELPIVELVTGLRPRSRDDLPIVGPAGPPGLHLATGHHRNGILLAPATAELVAAGVLGRPTDFAAAAFGPARFTPHTEVPVPA